MTKKKPLFSDENKVKELIEMYTGGASLRDCAAHFGCSTPTISTALKDNNIPKHKTGTNLKPKKKVISIDTEELTSLWETMSQQEIAKHFGVSVDTIVDRAKTIGLSRDHSLRNKIRHQTNVEKNGADYQKKKYEKYKKTMEEIYGRENFFSGEDGSNAVKYALVEKYGVENSAHIDGILEKRSESFHDNISALTNKEREELSKARAERAKKAYEKQVAKIGRHPAQYYWSEFTLDVLSSKEKLEKYITENGYVKIQAIADSLDVGYSTVQWRLHNFGIFHLVKCKTTSRFEVELKQILEEISGKEFNKTRKAIYPKEIDLYNDELKFGVEFNGTFWHSVQYEECEDGVYRPKKECRPHTYHRDKSFDAEKNGIFIFHVFEHQWTDPDVKPKIISQLRNLLGKNENKVYARKCVIDLNVPASESMRFLQENHVQGALSASVKIGLRHCDELVALMTFRKNNVGDWELSRFCNKTNMNVVGGASRLFNAFVREYNPEEVFSYSDIARTRGTMYENLGFKFVKFTQPNYWWINIFSEFYIPRYRTQMPNETQIMTDGGHVKMFDCGSRKLVWNR